MVCHSLDLESIERTYVRETETDEFLLSFQAAAHNVDKRHAVVVKRILQNTRQYNHLLTMKHTMIQPITNYEIKHVLYHRLPTTKTTYSKQNSSSDYIDQIGVSML